jgi:hypothetical protein
VKNNMHSMSMAAAAVAKIKGGYAMSKVPLEQIMAKRSNCIPAIPPTQLPQDFARLFRDLYR